MDKLDVWGGWMRGEFTSLVGSVGAIVVEFVLGLFDSPLRRET